MMHEIVQVIQISAAILTAIWAVMQIKSGQVRLSDAITRLDETIKDLRDDFLDHKETVTKDLSHIRERLILIESCKHKNGAGR